MSVPTKHEYIRALLLATIIALTGSQALLAQDSSWYCGAATNVGGRESVIAKFDGNTLTISGTGRMTDYFATATPWYSSRNSISNVIIERGVTSIGDFAFYDLTEMTSITIPYGVTSIGNGAFFKCARITDIDLPNSLISIGNSAFMECAGLTSGAIPDGVTEIPMNAFGGCRNLTSVAIPDNVTKIGVNAFGGCRSLTSVFIPYNVTEIGMNAFDGCTGLRSIAIPNSVTKIGMGAFSDCISLAEIAIPDGVTIISSTMFSGCTSLASVTIPGGVTSILNMPFYGCASLRSIISQNPSPPVANNLTFITTDNICLYVPRDYIAAYASANYWKNFSCIKSTDEYVSIAARDRVIPGVGFDGGAATVVPVNRLTAEFTAGPNPVGISQGTVSFFWQGSRIENATLSIYGASGDAVNTVKIEDRMDSNLSSAALTQEKRLVGSWNLRDKKDRAVPAGTFLVRGVIKTSGGKTERVSLVVGVR
jgi:hypothetical protein